MGSLLLRDLPEASREDLDDLPGEAGVKLGLIEPCVQAGQRIVQVSKLPEVGSCGEAEDAGGGEHGTEGEAFRRLVDLAAELAADGRAEGVGSVGGRLRRRSWCQVRFLGSAGGEPGGADHMTGELALGPEHVPDARRVLGV